MTPLRSIRRGWQERRGTRRLPLILTIAMSVSMAWGVIASEAPLPLSITVVALWPCAYVVGLWDEGDRAIWGDLYEGRRDEWERRGPF